MDHAASIRPFYDRWPTYNRRLREAVATLTPEQLAIRPSPEHAPVWALVAHTAGARLYWLCGVFGEPGAEATPFPEAVSGLGWEDDESRPRGADELVAALDSTWRIIEGCLDRWTPDMIAETVIRRWGDKEQVHSRSSVLQRLLTHEAFHGGELSQTFGVHGLPAIDLWRPD